MLSQSIEPYAAAMRYRVQAWECFFYLGLGVAFSLSVRVAGVLVIFSHLDILATVALVLDVGMAATFVVAVLIAMRACTRGVVFSYQSDLPTGPTIVATPFRAAWLLRRLQAARTFLGRAVSMSQRALVLLLVLLAFCSTSHIRVRNVDSDATDVSEVAIEVVNGSRREHVAVRDVDLCNLPTAGAVAFVSTAYVLSDTDGVVFWEADETRLPVRLGGSDLTCAALAKIVAEAVSGALALLPGSGAG